TSLSTPLFAGIVAVANQGRAFAGVGTLDGRKDLLPRLYAVPRTGFHDIISGNKGTGALTGYDLVSGRGTPAGYFVPDVVNHNQITGNVYEDNDAGGTLNDGDVPLSDIQLFIDANDNGVRDLGSTQTVDSGTLNLTIPDNNSTGLFNSQVI